MINYVWIVHLIPVWTALLLDLILLLVESLMVETLTMMVLMMMMSQLCRSWCWGWSRWDETPGRWLLRTTASLPATPAPCPSDSPPPCPSRRWGRPPARQHHSPLPCCDQIVMEERICNIIIIWWHSTDLSSSLQRLHFSYLSPHSALHYINLLCLIEQMNLEIGSIKQLSLVSTHWSVFGWMCVSTADAW